MKIKQLIVQICIGLLILMTVKGLLGGFVFSKSVTYVLIFLVLYSFSGWAVNRIQIFFLMPKIIFLSMALHALVLTAIFFVGNSIIGGITITSLQPSVLHLFSKSLAQQMSGDFGTIGVVSLSIGIVYQGIIWLNSEK
jgi:hypothetical protein